MITLQNKKRVLQGELADLALYKALRKRARGAFAQTLDAFIETETHHVAFWQKKFHLSNEKLGVRGRARNIFIRMCVRIFGESAGYILLEAVESHGIKQYLQLWQSGKDDETQYGLREILTEELHHEDQAATGGKHKVDAALVRNAFLGFNDGSVEILGAVSGLAAALQRPALIVAAAVTVSIAGAVSMAAGAFLSTHAERELDLVEKAKQAFLSKTHSEAKVNSPWRAAIIVGIGYIIGAAVPVAPFVFGATNALWSILFSGTLILLVSTFLAFLSGMSIRRRIFLNIGVITAAVSISYGIGGLLEKVIGN